MTPQDTPLTDEFALRYPGYIKTITPQQWLDFARSLERKLAAAERDAARLREALQKYGKRSHYYCDDSWYSCPKAPEGCANEAEGTECNCGADKHNAAIDAALSGQEGRTKTDDEWNAADPYNPPARGEEG